MVDNVAAQAGKAIRLASSASMGAMERVFMVAFLKLSAIGDAGQQCVSSYPSRGG